MGVDDTEQPPGEEAIQRGKSNIEKLQDELEPIGITVLAFFHYLRSNWIVQNIKGDSLTYVEKVLGKPLNNFEDINLDASKKEKLDEVIRAKKYCWGDLNFHIAHRITEYHDLINVVKEIDPEIESVIKVGYNLSILPLALVAKNKDLLHKFIPKKDFFTEHVAKSWDPYGIFSEKTKIVHENVYLASQKFKRSVLMNITSTCPIGCVGCYKGTFTRISGKKFYTDLEKAVSKQTELLVSHLNEHPEIKSVILSGGEPLLLKNEDLRKMLKEFKKARYLGEFRICTGVIFQGLPFRIDDNLLGILEDFENETGIKVNFNAHLGHPCQFTPEALVAVRKIIRRGFPINSQVPLQRNVNVFMEDFEETMKTLSELAQFQGISGVRPYKYILHMNVGSLEYSVPLEFMLKVLAELKYRPDHPWPETWQPVSFCILYQGGNLLLSPQLLFSLQKRVHEDHVAYKIPLQDDGGRLQVLSYKEPLLKGYNDNPESLVKLQEELHHEFKTGYAFAGDSYGN